MAGKKLIIIDEASGWPEHDGIGLRYWLIGIAAGLAFFPAVRGICMMFAWAAKLINH